MVVGKAVGLGAGGLHDAARVLAARATILLV